MQDFKFFLPVDISKSNDSEEHRYIRGYASTEVEDRQGESLVQKGLDISDFVNHGFFNYDHDNSIILGYPIANKCHVDSKGLWVEGEMFKGIPEADRIWDLAVAIKKSKAPRKVGFSVEGKVLERDGGRILKARIYNVAITTNPVNTTCSWEAVVKSFNNKDEIQFDSIDKSLEAGYGINPTELEGGGVFRKESLDEDLKNLSYVIGDDDKKKLLKEQLAKKSLTHAELTLYLQLTKGWSIGQCKDFIEKHL